MSSWLSKRKGQLFVVNICSFAFILLGLTTINAGELRLVPYSGTIYTDCYQPYDIYAETDSYETLSIDTKLFLNGDFALNPNVASGYTTYITGDMNELIYPFLTGTATANHIGEEYLYINTSDSIAHAGTIKVITLYLKALAAESETGYLTFYRSGGRNGDDSNISSGANNQTQVEDILTTVTDGEYFVTGYDFCPTRPYVYTSTYAQYTTTLTATGVLFNQRKEIYAGPSYIIEGAATDDTRNDWTNSTGWTIWTNTSVLLSITGNEPIQMVYATMYDQPYIYASGDVASGWEYLRQFWITGNIYTGFLTFDNIINNYGRTFLSGSEAVNENKYTEEFYIDVFRIDTLAPIVATGTYITGRGYTYVPLTGSESSGQTELHYTGLIMDDEFAIYLFSGNNIAGYGYDTTTGYNTDLINTYGGIAGSGFTMEKTILFEQSRSGYIYYTDRAGNTGSIFVEVEIDPAVDFNIYAIPAFRESANDEVHGRSGYATQADLWLAYENGGSRVFTHNSVLNSGTNNQVSIDHNGTGIVSIVPPVSGSTYLVALKATGMLAVGFTGIRNNDIFDTGTNYFDFTSGTNNVDSINGFYPLATYNNINYLKGGDAAEASAGQYDRIDNADLSVINGFLTVGLTFNGPAKNDRDLNAVINAIEQAITIQWDSDIGFIEYYTTGSTAIPNLTQSQFITF